MNYMAEPPLSPCVRRCTLDDEDVCLGCGRTLGEILEWANASLARKLEIRASLPERLQARETRRRS
jgi:predicted Fe-S protein YdhL (DUF1289 family)